MSQTKILDRIDKSIEDAIKYKGNASGAVYTSDQQHFNFISEVMRKTINTNPLYTDECLYIT